MIYVCSACGSKFKEDIGKICPICNKEKIYREYNYKEKEKSLKLMIKGINKIINKLEDIRDLGNEEIKMFRADNGFNKYIRAMNDVKEDIGNIQGGMKRYEYIKR